MNLYEKEQDEFGMYSKTPAGAFIHDFDPMSFDMKEVELRHQQQQQTLEQQPAMQHEQHRERKPKLPVEQHEHYIALVWTDNNKYSVRSSAGLKFCRSDVLNDAIPKFTHYVQRVKNGDYGFDHQGHIYNASFGASMNTCATVNGEIKPRSQKRKNGTEDVELSDEGHRQPSFQCKEDDSPPDNMVYFRADATEDWAKWFYNAFRAVQQTSCRVIAKEWIKTIHPKKQSTHPYNGKNPKTGERGDPSSTKPPYWPADVIHKEPDHINKEARTKLLVHLLMKTPLQEMSISGEPQSEKEITARMLKEPLDQKKHESQNKDLKKRFHIVQTIIETRTKLESYDQGGIGGETLIGAPDYSDYNRGNKADDDSDEHDPDDVPEIVDTDNSHDIDVDIRTEIAPDDTEYCLISKPEIPAARRLSQQQNGDNRKAKSASQRQRGGAETSRSSSFTSVQMTPHPGATQRQELIDHPPMVSPDWSNFRSPSIHMGPPNTSPTDIYSPHQMWRHAMQVQRPFSDHAMAPGHPMTMAAQPGMIDARFLPVQQHGFANMPMPGYARHPDYPPDMNDSRGIPLRTTTPQDFYMHPPPPGNPWPQ